jgi:hypothetical protein
MISHIAYRDFLAEIQPESLKTCFVREMDRTFPKNIVKRSFFHVDLLERVLAQAKKKDTE